MGGRRILKRLPIVAVAVLLGICSRDRMARAADPAFCRDYATAAVRQAREAWSIPRCRPIFESPRWATEYRLHLDWCLTTSYNLATSERVARTRHLEHCR
jgi:hypothetical protein